LRAGLLSDLEVLSRLKKSFVCTTIIIDDAKKRAEKGDELAKVLAANWEYPLELMFLTPDGKLISRLNSFRDFPGVHPDVVAPPTKMRAPSNDERFHIDVFLKHVTDHFGRE
jgi:hypothetical protein